VETKICSKCKEEKDICNFTKNSRNKGGINYQCKECDKKYYLENMDKIKNRSLKNYYQNHLENKEKQKNRRETNPDYMKKYREINNEKIKLKKKKYDDKNKEKRNEYVKNKYNTDILFRLKINLSSRLRKYTLLNNITKKNNTFEIIGCSPEFLKEHIENQFIYGMNWDNRSEWHIDHIIPLSSANTEEEVYKLCHYTNLQPLWAEDNLKKGCKIL
jgi:hypothetical protein